MDLGARHVVWKADLTLWVEARRRRRRLVRELDDYRSEAERDDLMAAVERCPSAARDEVRRLLVQGARRAEFERVPYHLHR
jgi:hypothetical protein